jgi:hypothetical protein
MRLSGFEIKPFNDFGSYFFRPLERNLSRPQRGPLIVAPIAHDFAMSMKIFGVQ